MTSKNPDVPDGGLMKLIYLHLKENGHKNAANVLKKHTPQVEATSVNVSLNDLYKKWRSENDAQGIPAGKEKTLGSSKGSGSKAKKPRNVKNNISSTSKKKTLTTAGSGNQKKKRTKKKEENSSAPLKGQTDLTSKSPAAGDDSDSDSSLDVEKWKRLVSMLSDADIAKMDALTPTSSTGRRTAQSKKQTSKNTVAKPPVRKTKAKTAISPSKTKKTDKSSKPRTKKTTSTVTADKVKTPSKRTKNKSNLLEKDISSSLSEQALIPKTNGVSENDGIKPKKKKNKNPENLSQTVTQAGTVKQDNPSEHKQVKTSSKKAKSKIIKSVEPVNVDTSSTGAGIEISSITVSSKKSRKTKDLPNCKIVGTPVKKVKVKKSVKAVEAAGLDSTQADTEVGDQSEKNDKLSDSTPFKTPSKKAKSKMIKSLEPVNVDTSSIGADTEMAKITLSSKKSKKLNDLPISKPVETPVKKVKLKKAVEAADLDTPSKQADTVAVGSDKVVDQSGTNDELSDSTLVKTPSKKAKSKKSTKSLEPKDVNTPSADFTAKVNSGHISSDQSETPSKQDKDKVSGEKTPKKTKSKKSKELVQPAELSTPSGEGDTEEANSHLQSPSNKPVTKKSKPSIVDPGTVEKLSKKVKAKKADSISELNGTETPSKKKVPHTGHTESENVTPVVTSSKTPKHLYAHNLTEALVSETPVKKSKTKKSPELNQATTPSNEASLEAGEPVKTKSSTKKSKSKKLDNVVQSDETSFVKGNGLSTSLNTASEEISSPSTQTKHKEKKRKLKDEDTVNVSVLEEGPEPKKRKKHKKKKKENEESVVEEVPSALQPEEIEDSLASNPERKKKKKNKKNKDKDEEKSVYEEEPPKKKKKSSRGKEHISDVAQEELL